MTQTTVEFSGNIKIKYNGRTKIFYIYTTATHKEHKQQIPIEREFVIDVNLNETDKIESMQLKL